MIEALSMLKSIKTEPYPGLRPFQANESHLFFGRDEQVEKLLEKIQNSHFVAVVGPSGCGKSSLVKAGLLPDLKTGFLMDEGRKCRTIEMRPGDKPFDNLARALHKSYEGSTAIGCIKAELKRGPKGLIEVIDSEMTPKKEVILLVVDQFEELFRYKQNNNMDEVIAFIALLIESANHSGDLAIHIVITMRSDFLGECSLFPGLPEILNDNQFLTPRLTRERMKEAIEAPARVCGGMLDPYLVNTLLNDVGVDHDQLPLLQHALMRMWALAKNSTTKKEPIVDIPPDQMKEMNRNKIVITMKHYAEIGKLNKALTQHANQAYDQLNEKQQKIAQVIFRRLSERNAEQKDVRRAATVQDIADVAEVDCSEVITVANIFIDPAYNFLTSSDDQLTPNSLLDISHESIIRQWDKMRDWISLEYRSANRYKRLIADSHDQIVDTKELLSGLELENILDWKNRNNINEPWALRYSDQSEYQQMIEYIDKSQNEKEEKIRSEKKRNRTRKAWKYSSTAAFAILLIALGIISFKSSIANEKARSHEVAARNKGLKDSLELTKSKSQIKQKELEAAILTARADEEKKISNRILHQRDSIMIQKLEIEKQRNDLSKLNNRLALKTDSLIMQIFISKIQDLPLYASLDEEDKTVALQELLPLYLKDSTAKGLMQLKSDLNVLTDLRNNYLNKNVPETIDKLQKIWNRHKSPLINSLITKTLNENLVYKQKLIPSQSGFIDFPLLAVSNDRRHFALSSDYYKFFGEFDRDSILADNRFDSSFKTHSLVEDSLYHDHWLSSIMYDNKKLITVEGNGNVIEFLPKAINFRTKIPTYENHIYKISPDAEYIITAPELDSNEQLFGAASKDRNIRLWKLPSSKKDTKAISINIMSTPLGMKDIIFNAKGDKAIFLFSNYDGKMVVWDLLENKKLYENSRIKTANFSSDGNKLITMSYTGNVKYVEANGKTNDHKDIQLLPGFDYTYDYEEIKLSPDLKKLIVKSDQQYHFYERANNGEIFIKRKDGSELSYKVFPWNQEPKLVEFLHDNSVLSINNSGEIYLWKIYPKFEGADEALTTIKTVPYYSTELLANDSSTLEKWFAQTNQLELDSIVGKLHTSVRIKDDPDRYIQNLDLSKKMYKRLAELTTGETRTSYEDEIISLNEELNEFDVSKMPLDQKLAVKLVPRLKENISIKENRFARLDTFEIKELSNDYWNLSWYQLFEGDYKGTIKSVNRGLVLHEKNDGMMTNLALAYLLDNRFDEAEALYKKYKGKKYANQQRYFTTSFLQDLDDMILAGIIKPTDKTLNEQVGIIRDLLKE